MQRQLQEPWRRQQEEDDLLSISQNITQEKPVGLISQPNHKEDKQLEDSARGGASTRRELFSANYRKEILDDLVALRNKHEDNEDIPIFEDPHVSQNGLTQTRTPINSFERRVTPPRSLVQNYSKIIVSSVIEDEQDKIFEGRNDTSLSGSSSDSSDETYSREVIKGHSSSEFCGLTVRHCEEDIEDDFPKQSDGKQSSSGLDAFLAYNGSVSRSRLPSLIPSALNHIDPFFQEPLKNESKMIISDGFGKKNNRKVSLLGSPKVEQQVHEIHSAPIGKSNLNKLRLGCSLDQHPLALAGLTGDYQDNYSQKLTQKQLTSASPIYVGKFRRGLASQAVLGNQVIGSNSPASGIVCGLQNKRKRVQSTSKNYLSIIYYVKKFENMLKTASTAYKFRSMNKKHFDMIGDISSNYSYYRLRSYLHQDAAKWHEHIWHRFQSVFRQLLWNPFLNLIFNQVVVKTGAHKIRVLQPESFAKQLWDIIAILIIVVNIFFIPIRLSFSLNSGEYLPVVAKIFLYWLPVIVLIFDLFINLNTAFYKNGLLIFDRSEIFHNYIRTHALWDSIVILPYMLSVFTGVIELKAFVLFRFNKIMDTIKQFEERLNLSDSQAAYVGLCKLIFLIIFVAHMCGCGFFLVSQIEKYYGYSPIWTDKVGADQLSIQSQYITSLYWSVITMITLGYGDIVPINTIERGFIIFVTMIACGVFGFSINKIGHLILEIGKSENEQKKKINMLMDLMHKRGLSNIPLLMKVRRNFQYLLNQAQENNQEGAKFLIQLDPNLKNEVMRDIYGKMLENKKMFKLNFSQYLIDQLCLKMKEHTYGPEDVIVSEDNIVDKIFFILQGEAISFINLASKTKKSASGKQSSENTVQVRLPEEIHVLIDVFLQQVLANLNKGDFFGEKAFFSNSKSEYGVKACTVVTVAYFSMKDMMECLQERQSDLERFCLLRDNLQVYNITKGLGVRCFGCNKYTHTIIHCPHSKYVPNQEKVLFINGISTDQERQKATRRKLHISNILAIYEDVHNAAIKFIIETFGIDTINQYFEERDNDFQHLHSPHNNNNINAKAIETAMNKSCFQILHQPSTNNVENNNNSGYPFHHVNNGQSPKNKAGLFPYGNHVSQDNLHSLAVKEEDNNHQTQKQSVEDDGFDGIQPSASQLEDIQLLNLPNNKLIHLNHSENIIFEDNNMKQTSQISSYNSFQFNKPNKGTIKIENSDLEPGPTIPTISDVTQQFLTTPKARIVTKKLSWSVSQAQPQRQTSISSLHNGNKPYEKDKYFRQSSSQGVQKGENEQEEGVKQQGNSSLLQQQFHSSRSRSYKDERQTFERQKSKPNKDQVSQDDLQELPSLKELKSAMNQSKTEHCKGEIEKEEKSEQNISFNVVPNFDLAKEYQLYFPHNNLKEILSKYNSHIFVSPILPSIHSNRQEMQKLLKGIKKKNQKAPKRFRERKSIFNKSDNNSRLTSQKSQNDDNLIDFHPDLKFLKIQPFQSTNNHPQTDKTEIKTQYTINKAKENAIEHISQQMLTQEQIVAELKNKSENIISQTEQFLQKFAFGLNQIELTVQHRQSNSQLEITIPNDNLKNN